MNRDLINKVEQKYIKADRPQLQVGDTVVVNTIIRDRDKKRYQKFQGIVIAMNGSGMAQTFTVRKISYGIGVEKIFPVHSANIDSIEVLKHAKVRRAKLYYLRDRVGKAAMKLKGEVMAVVEGKDESNVDEVMEAEDIKEEVVEEDTKEEVTEEEVTEEAAAE